MFLVLNYCFFLSQNWNLNVEVFKWDSGSDVLFNVIARVLTGGEMSMSGKQSTNGGQVVIDIPSEETNIEARGSCSKGSESSASKGSKVDLRGGIHQVSTRWLSYTWNFKIKSKPQWDPYLEKVINRSVLNFQTQVQIRWTISALDPNMFDETRLEQLDWCKFSLKQNGSFNEGPRPR